MPEIFLYLSPDPQSPVPFLIYPSARQSKLMYVVNSEKLQDGPPGFEF